MKKLLFLFFFALSIFSSPIVFAMEEDSSSDGEVGLFVSDDSGRDSFLASDNDTDSSYSSAEEESETDSDSDDSDYDSLPREEFDTLSVALQRQIYTSIENKDECFYVVLHLLAMLKDAVQNKASKNKVESFIKYYKCSRAEKLALGKKLQDLLKLVIKNEPQDKDGNVSELVGYICHAIRDELVNAFPSKGYLVYAVLSYLYERFVNKENGCVTKFFLEFLSQLKFCENNIEKRNTPDASKFYKANVIENLNRWMNSPGKVAYEESEFDDLVAACLTDDYSIDNHRVLLSLFLRSLWQRHVFKQTKQKIVIESDAWTSVLTKAYLLLPDILNGDIFLPC